MLLTHTVQKLWFADSPSIASPVLCPVLSTIAGPLPSRGQPLRRSMHRWVWEGTRVLIFLGQRYRLVQGIYWALLPEAISYVIDGCNSIDPVIPGSLPSFRLTSSSSSWTLSPSLPAFFLPPSSPCLVASFSHSSSDQ